MATFFSDAFELDKSVVDDFGAFDISIINDLPLFIDPFLLFHSEKDEYQKLHEGIIQYLVFLRDRASDTNVTQGMLRNWYCFPEVKQNWLGFSVVGNSGSGLGLKFAKGLSSNLNVVFSNFGQETITKSSHLEKVCLVSSGVGRDNISDFVTNLIQDFLCTYTEEFAKKYLRDDQTRTVWIDRAIFNYETMSWQRKQFILPWFQDDFIILTPKDLLTRDDTWISSEDLFRRFKDIPKSIDDSQIRASVNAYFQSELDKRRRKNQHPSQEQIKESALKTINQFPELIDYYVKMKEDTGDEARDISAEHVSATELFFSTKMREILQKLLAKTEFYKTPFGSYKEAHVRLAYLKHVIEDMGGWRLFYNDKNQTVQREKDLQILYRLVWFGTPSDVSTEANDGRGPVDFKISRGRDKTLIEMKLAKNTKLEMNLKHQTEVYKAASDSQKEIKVIIYFSYSERQRVDKILKRLGLTNSSDVVLIDARRDNKQSASNVVG